MSAHSPSHSPSASPRKSSHSHSPSPSPSNSPRPSSASSNHNSNSVSTRSRRVSDPTSPPITASEHSPKLQNVVSLSLQQSPLAPGRTSSSDSVITHEAPESDVLFNLSEQLAALLPGADLGPPGTLQYTVSSPNLLNTTTFQCTAETRRLSDACKRFFVHYYKDLGEYMVGRKKRITKAHALAKTLPIKEAECLLADAYFKEKCYQRLRRTRMRIRDYQILSRLGKGGFGEVYLARHSQTGQIVALKRMKKLTYKQKNLATTIRREREVLKQGTATNWLIRLFFTFQDLDNLYIAMEFAPGGDLRLLLENLGALEEKAATFYFAEMLLAVNTLHSLGFIHRDIKPSNFVIDKHGHLKLIDFGLSKDGLDDRFRNSWRSLIEFNKKKNTDQVNGKWKAFSVVGSPDYMCPEMLEGGGYDQSADIWSLGCILFEMVSGYPPFAGETVQEVINWSSILARPELPEDAKPLSDQLWSAIESTICCNTNRMSIPQLLQHPLMKRHSVPVDDMRGHAPPFIPALNGEADTSYFEEPDPEQQQQQKQDQEDLEKLLAGYDVPLSERNTGEFAYFTWKAFPEDLKQQIEKHRNSTSSTTSTATKKEQSKAPDSDSSIV